MEDFIRLVIPDERLKNVENNKLKLTKKEAHYLNQVMRIRFGGEIFLVNGRGSLWKAKKIENNMIYISSVETPYIFEKKNDPLLGLVISIPRNGFEDILRMSTEIGFDLIQPVYSDRQIKRIANKEFKRNRWDLIINESVEQCERLWKPQLLDIINIAEWIKSVSNKDIVSASVTREKNNVNLKRWLNKMERNNFQGFTIWNIIGPEGGWSKNELKIFDDNKFKFVKLSKSILRTSTAAVASGSILSEWRDYYSNNLIK